VHCGYRNCGWTTRAIGARNAQLIRETHMSTCLHRPNVERASTELLRCRLRGCGHMIAFKRGQLAWATEERKVHERNCPHR
jgi:hypothetical protein